MSKETERGAIINFIAAIIAMPFVMLVLVPIAALDAYTPT